MIVTENLTKIYTDGAPVRALDGRAYQRSNIVVE
jgi:hypothetical protein